MKNQNGYIDSFKKLIQCPTVTESGSQFFADFQKVLESEFPLLHQKAEIIRVGGDAIMFKVKGLSDKKPLVLMAHQDVVPAVGGEWKYDPFSGEIEDGKIYGRGTMDCKNTLFCTAQAVEELLEENATLPYDIYLSYSDNEETGGTGARMARNWLEENGIKPFMAVDEGGAIVEKLVPQMKRDCAAIGIVEKGYMDVKFVAKGSGGHSSQPPKHTPIARLAKFINYVESHKIFKPNTSNEFKKMIVGIADTFDGPIRFLLKNVSIFAPLIKAISSKIPIISAMTSTSIVFTMQDGAPAPNVIPESAYVIANLRIAPHDKGVECLSKLEKIAKKYDIEAEVLMLRDATEVVDINGEGYQHFVSTLNAVAPEVVAVPYIICGGTDCRTMQEIVPCAIRCTPTKMTVQQLNAMHASNENLNIDALDTGIKFFKKLIVDLK